MKIIYFSDLHLESDFQKKFDFFVPLINQQIQANFENEDSTVVVLAGDIHNTKKKDELCLFLSSINTNIIYVAGNHEFWGNDFYESQNILMNKLPKNTHYLYNDLYILEDTIFIGSTMWTDIGLHINPDIIKHSGRRMNDVYEIKANKWYESEENINKIKSQKDNFYAEDLIKNKNWNSLIQIEENKKTTDFFNAFGFVFSAIKKAKEIGFKPNSLQEMFKYENPYQLFHGTDYKKWENNQFVEYVFKKLINIKLLNKNVVVVSHHLPFLEEMYVGKHKFVKYEEDFKPINSVDERFFMIKSGDNYPVYGQRYFFESNKGRINNELSDMGYVFNYFNNGHHNISSNLLDIAQMWIHGHKHSYKYEDFVKNIPICTNPIGYQFFHRDKLPQDKILSQAKIYKHNELSDIQIAWNLFIFAKINFEDMVKQYNLIDKKILNELEQKNLGVDLQAYTSLHDVIINKIKNYVKLFNKSVSCRNNQDFNVSDSNLDLIYSNFFNFLSEISNIDVFLMDKLLLEENILNTEEVIHIEHLFTIYVNTIFKNNDIFEKILTIQNNIKSNLGKNYTQVESPFDLTKENIKKLNALYNSYNKKNIISAEDQERTKLYQKISNFVKNHPIYIYLNKNKKQLDF